MNKANDAIKALERLKYYDLDDIRAVLTDNYIDFDFEDYMMEYGFVSDEEADDMIKCENNNSSLDRMVCFLANVDYINQDYYYLNGYGNLENVGHDILESFRSDLIRKLKEEDNE